MTPLELWLKRTLRPLLREWSYHTSRPRIRPTEIFFDITDRCQLRCVTCSKWTTPDIMKEKELSTDHWKMVILQLKEWLGFYTVFFCGGEPFLREDLLELIDFAAEHGVYSSVISNGYDIEPFAKEIVRSRLASLHISLNGVSSDVHDASRGVPGSLKKTMNAIFALNQKRHERVSEKLWLNISTVLMPENVHEILPLLEWVEEHGLDSLNVQMIDDKQSFHSFARVKEIKQTDQYRLPENMRTLWEQNQPDILRVLEALLEKKRKGNLIANSEAQLEAMKNYVFAPHDILNIPCRIGVSNFSVDAYGNTRLCFNMAPIGNILDTAPETLWKSDAARLQRQQIKRCQMYCRLLACNFS